MSTNFPANLDDNTTLPPASTLASEDLSTFPHSVVEGNQNDAIKATEAIVGVTSSTVTTSHEYRLYSLEHTGVVDVQAHNVLPTNTAAVNASALNALIGFMGAFGGGKVYFRPGIYPLAPVTIAASDITLMGDTHGNSVLDFASGTSGQALLTFAGTEDNPGTYAGHIYRCGAHRLKLTDSAVGNAVGIKIAAMQGADFSHLEIEGFRGHGLQAQNFEDSSLHRVDFDFCGSADDSNRAVIDYGIGTSAEDAVNNIIHDNCRLENSSDMQVSIVSGGGHVCNSITFTNECKFENSLTNSNGLSGTLAQFNISGGADIAFVNSHMVLQGLQNGTHAILPRMFYVTNGCNGVVWDDCYIDVGSIGAVKPFTTFWECDGTASDNYGLFWTNTVCSAGNSAAIPTQTWKFTSNNRKSKVGPNAGWANTAGGTPTLTSGSITSAPDF